MHNTRNNPWNEINLNDYENHMKSSSVLQLQAMNAIMKDQFYRYPCRTITVLGVAGGNGLEHIDPGIIETVYGVDINRDYLEECKTRFHRLADTFVPLCVDLTEEPSDLPHADLIVANLLIEYIGYPCFQETVRNVRPSHVSCVIQINTDTAFVSDSPYLHAFDRLEAVHHQIEAKDLESCMSEIGYRRILLNECPLPNGKKLVRLDFCHQNEKESLS